MKKIAVCDTSSVIKFQRGNLLSPLSQIFETLMIPEAVLAECIFPETKQAALHPLFQIYPVNTVLPIDLGLGERAAISLAVEKNIKILIMEDKRAIKQAIRYGLSPIITIELLPILKAGGFIQSVRGILEMMLSNGEGIDDNTYREVLVIAGEFPLK